MACCSDDGKVSIVGLFTAKYNNTIPFEKSVKVTLNKIVYA